MTLRCKCGTSRFLRGPNLVNILFFDDFFLFSPIPKPAFGRIGSHSGPQDLLASSMGQQHQTERQQCYRLVISLLAILVTTLAVHVSSFAGPPPQETEATNRLVNNSANQTSAALRLFISGHSLVDQPLPNHLAAIASSLGTPLDWNRQYIVGSSISARSRGVGSADGSWQGYQRGFNRTGEGLDVISELRNPKTVSGARYDALLITEQHGLLGSLTWHDTVRYLRHYHDRLIAGNPRATTYFYESWLGLNDKSDPRRWIAYERAASPIWQCIATRINASLDAEGRVDRIKSLPAGAALADLVDHATRPDGLPGISQGNTRSTVDSLVRDDVHLTELGTYYIALVSYSFIFGKSPSGAWHPNNVTEVQADSLQKMASGFASRYTTANRPLTLEDCSEQLRSNFIGTYWGYVRDASWMRETNLFSAYFRWLRHVGQWHWRMRKDSTDNPFLYRPESDKGYWFADPR